MPSAMTEHVGRPADALAASLSDALALVASTTANLAAACREQSGAERAIEELCGAVWIVRQQHFSISGKCGNAQQYTVSHEYTLPVATIDPDRLGRVVVLEDQLLEARRSGDVGALADIDETG